MRARFRARRQACGGRSDSWQGRRPVGPTGRARVRAAFEAVHALGGARLGSRARRSRRHGGPGPARLRCATQARRCGAPRGGRSRIGRTAPRTRRAPGRARARARRVGARPPSPRLPVRVRPGLLLRDSRSGRDRARPGRPRGGSREHGCEAVARAALSAAARRGSAPSSAPTRERRRPRGRRRCDRARPSGSRSGVELPAGPAACPRRAATAPCRR